MHYHASSCITIVHGDGKTPPWRAVASASLTNSTMRHVEKHCVRPSRCRFPASARRYCGCRDVAAIPTAARYRDEGKARLDIRPGHGGGSERGGSATCRNLGDPSRSCDPGGRIWRDRIGILSMGTRSSRRNPPFHLWHTRLEHPDRLHCRGQGQDGHDEPALHRRTLLGHTRWCMGRARRKALPSSYPRGQRSFASHSAHDVARALWAR